MIRLTAKILRSAKKEILKEIKEMGYDMTIGFESIYETKNHLCFEIEAIKFQLERNTCNRWIFRVKKSNLNNLEWYEIQGFSGNCININ